MLTEVERRRVHVPEEAKVGAKVVGDELSAECCGNLWSKFKIPYTENGQTPDTGQRTPEIPNPRFSVFLFYLRFSRKMTCPRFSLRPTFLPPAYGCRLEFTSLYQLHLFLYYILLI
jgi:hypothetical protein